MKPKETDYEKLATEINAYMKQQEAKLVEKALVIEHLKKRLIESAIENVGYKCDASDVFEDIAKNRIDIWINELYVGNVLGKKHPVWIPCAVDLPKKDGEYLVCLEKGYREDYGLSEVEIMPFEVDCEGFGYWDEYFDKEKMASLGSDWRELPVIAWRPLPEPYRGD